ncbi:hypothetical protein [Nocardioides aurantiacus]|uniref:Homeodomain-like domain-containing protein n=1 Tax=Nocardioides aurantiacus TaxID=86796 RepID=A0A3N2CUI9_9ACTN|nr:hypothetical protein [Nocardioides aurantiacus]ROR90884.1 hypothetical protein EDD33_1733 [Nocardioides aurantiacus]
MPPRRRRAGYRPGQLSPELRAAIAAEADQLGQITEPLELIDAVGDVYAALDTALEPVALPRLRAVAELRRQGWSYDRLAEATKLSKTRVAQLAREAVARGL